MEVPSQQNNDAAVRDIPASYPFNDPQLSSTPTWSGQNHNAGSSYFSPSNMISPQDQSNPTHCTFSPVQISYHSLAYGQAHPLRHEPLPHQRTRYDFDARDNSASSYSQPPSSPEQYHINQGHRLSSDLLESPNWSMASNPGSGRSLSVSQLEGENAGGSSSSYAQSYRRYTGDHAEHDADDEGSDAMSDGIASDEGVYYSSGSDRDVFDDEDFGSFEVDSDEEYDSDEYSDS